MINISQSNYSMGVNIHLCNMDTLRLINQKFPDNKGVLTFQVIHTKHYFEFQISMWIMQVPLFSSVHNNKFHW